MTAPRFSLMLHAIGIFLFGFAFIYVCYSGLPIDFHADYLNDSLRSLKNVTIPELIQRALNPLTPGWFYPPGGYMEYMRPLQVLFFHGTHHFSPYSLTPVHMVAAVCHGLLAVLLAMTLYHWTGRFLYGWLAAVLYASFPSNFYIMASIAPLDFQYLVSILTLSSLLIFYSLTSRKWRRGVSFFLMVFAWVGFLWFNIKLKSSEKIIPFVCLAFLIWRFRWIRSRIGNVRILVLLGAVLAMMVLVVPLRPFESWIRRDRAPTKESIHLLPTTPKDQKAFVFHWKNALQRTFYLPGGEFPFTTPHRDQMPRSFTENLGFFVGWFFWLSLLLMPLVLSKTRAQDLGFEQARWEETKHFFWLIGIWFAAMIAGFASGVALEDPRYLNFAYVPFFLLFPLAVHLLQKRFFAADFPKAILLACLSLAVAYTAATNLKFLGKLVGHFGGMQDVLVRAEKDVFRDFFGRDPVEDELYQRHQELETRAVVVDWYQLPENWLDLATAKVNKEGKLYFYSRTQDPQRLGEIRKAGYGAELWRRYDFLDARPPIFRFFKATAELKRRVTGRWPSREVLVYRIHSAASLGDPEAGP